jgi:hypothetical protein
VSDLGVVTDAAYTNTKVTDQAFNVYLTPLA